MMLLRNREFVEIVLMPRNIVTPHCNRYKRFHFFKKCPVSQNETAARSRIARINYLDGKYPVKWEKKNFASIQQIETKNANSEAEFGEDKWNRSLKKLRGTQEGSITEVMESSSLWSEHALYYNTG